MAEKELDLSQVFLARSKIYQFLPTCFLYPQEGIFSEEETFKEVRGFLSCLPIHGGKREGRELKLKPVPLEDYPLGCTNIMEELEDEEKDFNSHHIVRGHAYSQLLSDPKPRKRQR